ncbi:MAG: CoA transferase [Dehalococcoidia bacterium]|nr:CoA transferase [Dehalococcoidia bacterium]
MTGEPMLAPYRVLDLTNEWGFLCGRLLGDFGADVIKIEKPCGDPSRNIGPFFRDNPDSQKSLYWFFYNANKRGITLDIETADGKEIFKKLIKTVDFVLESFEPGYMDKLGLGYSALSEINPRIILTSITPFGQTGPYSTIKPSDIAAMALCGWMYQCGDEDRPPVRIGLPQAYVQGAAQAVGGTLAAHYYRETTGEGQHYDAAAFPWLAYIHQNHVWWYASKKYSTRHGPRWEWTGRPISRYVWECKDGYIAFAVLGGNFGLSQKALVDWMDTEGMAPDFMKEIKWTELDFDKVTQEFRDRFEEPIVKFFKLHTRAEIFHEAVKRRIVLLPIYSPKDMLESPELNARGYWIPVEHPELGTAITYPGAFFKSSETAWSMRRRAPFIGEHNEEIYTGELGLSKQELAMLKQGNII